MARSSSDRQAAFEENVPSALRPEKNIVVLMFFSKRSAFLRYEHSEEYGKNGSPATRFRRGFGGAVRVRATLKLGYSRSRVRIQRAIGAS